jgi:predicted nucleic acid-binding protein
MNVDANVWVSLFVRSDVFHPRCRLWIRAQLAGGVTLVIPSLAVAEVAGSVSRVRNSSHRGRRVARWLLESPAVDVITLHDALVHRAAQIAADYQIRGSDSIYVTVADEIGLPLVTLDQELQTRAAAIVNVIHP